MLEAPTIEAGKIMACLAKEYDLVVEAVSFLPIGADQDTAAYRVETRGGRSYFLKLRRGAFVNASVVVPNTLFERGIQQVIPAILTHNGALWTNLEDFTLILYPFITGVNGYEVRLADHHWIKFGWALKQFHSTVFPNEVVRDIPQETFSPKWRDRLRSSLERISREGFQDPLAVDLAAFLDDQRSITLALVDRAEDLAQTLSSSPAPMILCHGDIHGWNLLIDQDRKLYMVDWDTLVWAPKERDLMFVGGGLGGIGRNPQEEMDLFYQGYGPVKINTVALAYYRCERIIEDLAIYCSVIFDSSDGGEDRRQSLGNLKSNYRSGGTLEIAMGTPALDS